MGLRNFFKNRSLYDLLGMPLMIFFIGIALTEAIVSDKVILREAFLPSLVFVIVYLGMVFSIPDDRRQTHIKRSRLVFISFALVMVSMAIAHYLSWSDNIALIIDTIVSIYFSVIMLLLVLFTVNDLLRSSIVNIKMILSGFCGYLMVALAWQNIYHALQLCGFQVFENALTQSAADYTEVYIDNFYFSLVTISTLGYGDLVPVGSLARMVAAAEAVAGQFYITILIGIMVGKYLRDNKAPKAD